MTKKAEGQVEQYVESALLGKNGVDITKRPTDPTNEKAFEAATDMPPGEVEDFETEVKAELGGGEAE